LSDATTAVVATIVGARGGDGANLEFFVDAVLGAVALGVLRWLNGPAISENALVEELTTFVWGAMSATAAAGGRSRSRRASGVAGELTSGLTCARIALACNRSGHSATAYRRGEQQCPRDPQSAFGSCAPVSPPLNMGPGAGSGPDHQIAIIGARPGGICADDRKQPKAKARKASGAG
jgi:hypothetical protein